MKPLITPNHLLTTMKILSTLQAWLPELHNYSDENQRHHIGCTWHGSDGLRDTHDLGRVWITQGFVRTYA